MTNHTNNSDPYYNLLEDWMAIWRYADASAIFYYSEEGAAEAFTTDVEAFDADVRAVNDAIGACMQASVSEEGITASHLDNLTVALDHLWDHVVDTEEAVNSFEGDKLDDFEHYSRGALKWATWFKA